MKIQSRAFFIIMIGAHNWRFDSAKVISILQWSILRLRPGLRQRQREKESCVWHSYCDIIALVIFHCFEQAIKTKILSSQLMWNICIYVCNYFSLFQLYFYIVHVVQSLQFFFSPSLFSIKLCVNLVRLCIFCTHHYLSLRPFYFLFFCVGKCFGIVLHCKENYTVLKS